MSKPRVVAIVVDDAAMRGAIFELHQLSRLSCCTSDGAAALLDAMRLDTRDTLTHPFDEVTEAKA